MPTLRPVMASLPSTSSPEDFGVDLVQLPSNKQLESSRRDSLPQDEGEGGQALESRLFSFDGGREGRGYAGA